MPAQSCRHGTRDVSRPPIEVRFLPAPDLSADPQGLPQCGAHQMRRNEMPSTKRTHSKSATAEDVVRAEISCVPLVADRLPLYADLRFTRHEIDREPFIRELIRCEHLGLRAFEASSERLHVALERSRESACRMLVDISEHEAVGLFVEW